MDGVRAPTEKQNHRPLSAVLAECVATLDREPLTVGNVANRLGDRSLEAVLLILALPMFVPVPAPGISIVFGLPMTILSLQLAFGRRQVWLPPTLAERTVSPATFARVIESSLPTLRRMERLVRPRLGWLASDWAEFPIGLICAVLALIIVLPIPLGHFVPGAAIAFLALGLLERDGLVVGLGLTMALFGLALVTLASFGMTHVLRQG